MSTRYELVEWDDFGYNLPRSLPYPSAKTIVEAVANIRSAGTFVVAVENGVRRSLTKAEESEFQSAYRDHMNRIKPRCRVAILITLKMQRNTDSECNGFNSYPDPYCKHTPKCAILTRQALSTRLDRNYPPVQGGSPCPAHRACRAVKRSFLPKLTSTFPGLRISPNLPSGYSRKY